MDSLNISQVVRNLEEAMDRDDSALLLLALYEICKANGDDNNYDSCEDLISVVLANYVSNFPDWVATCLNFYLNPTGVDIEEKYVLVS